MKTIIASIDFSGASINAAGYAADLARRMQAQLLLFHVCAVPLPLSEIPITVEDMENVLDEAETEIRRLKEMLENKNGGPLTITTAVRSGIFLFELQELCAAVQPAVVVMAPHGKGAIETFLFGNNAMKAVTGIPCPLLIVPPGTVYTGIRKIGLAYDYTNPDTVPVTEIKDLIQLFNAKLHVVHVSTRAPEPHAPAGRELDTFKTMLTDLDPVYYSMYRPDIDKGIAEFARELHPDLMIVIPHSHSLLGGIFHKSHTKHLLLDAQVPIMAIHEQAR